MSSCNHKCECGDPDCGPYSADECPECDNGYIVYGGDTVIRYKDSRSMLCADGQTFLCGPCASGDVENESYLLLIMRDKTRVGPMLLPTAVAFGLDLTAASRRLGKRMGYLTDVAIVSDRSHHEADLELCE